MKKILIAGGVGFIGSHLIKNLSRDNNCKIHVIDNFSRGKFDFELKELFKNRNIKVIEADLTKNDFYKLLDTDYAYIYNFAAIVGVRNVTEDPDKTLLVNSFSILNLLEWIRKKNKGLKKLIFASTSEVYAGTLKCYGIPIPTDENVSIALDDISLARTTYALSKIMGESACFNYYQKYKIPFTILRFHNVYGPRMGHDHVIPELLLKAKVAKEYLEVSSANHTRAFCYIDDAVRAIICLSTTEESTGQIFNVGNSDEEIAIVKLAQKIISIVNPSLQVKELCDAPSSPLRRCPDITKLKSITGFIPKFKLDEGLQLTWNWYKNVTDSIKKDRVDI